MPHAPLSMQPKPSSRVRHDGEVAATSRRARVLRGMRHWFDSDPVGEVDHTRADRID